ncbi:MAG: 50S ribosomal protein L11 methyltransferase [Acidobacteria bacterium]|nr:50S ribosomal protein L11 methyltransferase [Acidobacteriota bacterium]
MSRSRSRKPRLFRPPTDGDNLRCLRVVVPASGVDEAAGRLWLHEPVAIHEAATDDGRVALLAGFDDLATAAMVAGELPPEWEPTVETAPDDSSWRDNWRAFVEPVEVGRVLVWPGWWTEPPPERHDGLVIRLDPGATFGSGSHPSTRLSLAALQQVLHGGDQVLDLGCGSGILSVAAALLDAAAVTALDIDPEATLVTERNAVANGVGVECHSRSVQAGDGPFDVVVANIGAAVLCHLAPVIVGSIARGGRLVVAGMLSEQAASVTTAFAIAGLRLVSTDEQDGWAVAVLRR